MIQRAEYTFSWLGNKLEVSVDPDEDSGTQEGIRKGLKRFTDLFPSGKEERKVS